MLNHATFPPPQHIRWSVQPASLSDHDYQFGPSFSPQPPSREGSTESKLLFGGKIFGRKRLKMIYGKKWTLIFGVPRVGGTPDPRWVSLDWKPPLGGGGSSRGLLKKKPARERAPLSPFRVRICPTGVRVPFLVWCDVAAAVLVGTSSVIHGP